MDNYNSDRTISLWEDSTRKSITLKNRKTGERFSFILKHSFIVGRLKPPSDMQITRDDMYISGRHLCFENMNNMVYVKDLNSKNGTWLNGHLLSAKTRIRQGDVLKIGRTEFDIILG